MYESRDLVLCQVHGAFGAGATTLQLRMLNGVPPWRLPPATTDAGAVTPTYGRPLVLLTLMDVPNILSAKMEIIRCKFSGVETSPGSGIYEATNCERGFAGTTDQAWSDGSYIAAQICAAHLALETEFSILRTHFTIIHARDSAMTWDGTNFKFGKFRVLGVGNGVHFSTAGFLEVYFPANGSVITGFGGASNHTVAGGVIAIPENTALYYEHNVATGANASIDANWRLVSYNSGFVVPKHWILIAHHCSVVIGGEGTLRVSNGATLTPWRAVGAVGQPAFQNSWVNFGGGELAVGFRKCANQIVRLRGSMKSGTVTAAAFYLPIGYRPTAKLYFLVLSNNNIGVLRIDTDGGVVLQSGSNAAVTLDAISFQAEL